MRKALVLGLGVSGLAAAEFLLRQQVCVIGVDSKLSSLANNSHFLQLCAQGLIVSSDQAEIDWQGIDRLVVSPGISPQHPLYREAKLRSIEIIGEAELAFRHLKQPTVAITGTNGKTTVTLLVEHVLKTAGIKARALGNVGNPLTAYLLNPDPSEVIVAELSSYQLETMGTPTFEAGVLLNITPDHLDRYADMEEYAKAKCRLQECVKADSPFFVHVSVARLFGHLLKPNYQVYGLSENVECFLPIRYRDLGMHESENALAAWALCKQFSVTPEQFCHGLETFKKPPHRIEFVTTIDGVSFYDDSKGTNLEAVIRAVQAMSGPVILIVGGVDKGASYLPWKEHFQGKVKRMIAIGQAAPKIYRELNLYMDMELADTLASAVEISLRHAAPGDNVLLSPGCSSYDCFRDYTHRGEEFQRSVYTLRERRMNP